jgi:hypothetical protein
MAASSRRVSPRVYFPPVAGSFLAGLTVRSRGRVSWSAIGADGCDPCCVARTRLHGGTGAADGASLPGAQHDLNYPAIVLAELGAPPLPLSGP